MKLKTATLIALICVIIHMCYVLARGLMMLMRTGTDWEWLLDTILFNGGLIVFFSVLYRKQE